MVTRVDKKPIIYNSCLLRVLRPSIVGQRKELADRILEMAVGHAIPTVSAREVIDDYEDIDICMRAYGINDPAFSFLQDMVDDDEAEAIEIARSMVRYDSNVRAALRSASVMDKVSAIQGHLIRSVSRAYFGTEAVYAFLSEFRAGNIIRTPEPHASKAWVCETAQKVCAIQAPYLFIHPAAVMDMTHRMVKGLTSDVWEEWAKYKAAETIALRLFSKRNLAAHANLYGISRRGFEESEVPLDDFEVKLHSEMRPRDEVKVYIILGIKYIVVGGAVYCLSQDDCINLASMAQCFYRNSSYFTVGNGYPMGFSGRATGIADGILIHCRKLIDLGKNFSHAIRALHILAQGDFNDIYEHELGIDLGWRDRSCNYIQEAKSLDPAALFIHGKTMGLARSNMDKLNVGFIYHCFVGDEMLISDLKSKVATMPSKVRDADKGEWSTFIKFCKAYLLSRFMMIHKRKPRVAGDVTQLNESWATRCINGQFTMPPQSTWGDTWISNEFSYTKFADTWHLDAQDVSYVVKDSKGIVSGKYANNRLIHSELLMAMTGGNVLDILTGSTPSSARDRIVNAGKCSEVAITTAPKAENAKPSWKKRVTFAADCEFRKLQAEYDRNFRKVMGFVRGPSLGVDQSVLEKQFADIAAATEAGLDGGICSHDISAWSESMDRDRKFEFEKVILDMLDISGMENIKLDWDQIQAVVSKQGTKEIVPLTNGSFQGFDGSASTLLHSMILLYCIDSARRKKIMSTSIKTNMATLIDDCIALMSGLTNKDEANAFWAHLKATYMKLGFEVDDLKSIFSTIKAIYLSRRFLCGAEVPADYKVFVKTHMSYEDPLRCSLDAPSDLFGALRGAADANGNAWFIYLIAVISSLSEMAFHNPTLVTIPPAGASVFALAPATENGWSIPSILDWATNDVTDKRGHFNALMECAAVYTSAGDKFKKGYDVYTRTTAKALLAIKSQAWRIVSVSNIFTNPFEAIREGPLKPDMLRRNAVQDLLRETATAEPWVSLLAWNVSLTTEKVRNLLVGSGPLHAPTLAALVNCMPDNYRLSLVGKAVGSQSLLDLLPKGARSNLKRRVSKCSSAYFAHSVSIYKGTTGEYSSSDFAALTYTERTSMEREEFYSANGCEMIDHTFPDPVATFTHAKQDLGSFISPNLASLIPHDRLDPKCDQAKDLFSARGVYVPRRSSRVWEITSEYAKGWDSVSQRVAMGLAVLARAEADGHEVRGLLSYFIKSWNELSDITPHDTHLISIHGSIKRLDSNPGSSTHPIIVHRNILRGINFNIKTSIDAFATELERTHDSPHNLHDPLSHECGILTATALQLACLISLKVADSNLRFNVATRPDCIIPESTKKMTTNRVDDRINIEIMESDDNYGLLQACPDLAEQIAIPTMKSSWVRMINALIDGDPLAAEELRREAASTPIDLLLQELRENEAEYTTSVVIASEPANRGVIHARSLEKYALVPQARAPASKGDAYTMSVAPIQSKFSRALSHEQPDYLVSAVIIRSIVWDRLKSRSLIALAAIYYDDPDKDLDILKECATQRFWKSVIVEVSRIKKRARTSEMLMKGFRSLGVADIHIKASDDTAELMQSVASFFGANLPKVIKLVSDQVLSVAGRSQNDFLKPFLQKVVTNNPTMFNIKLRKEHLANLIKYNLDHLSKRIELLKEGEIVHRGDKRASDSKIRRHGRLVELRCRKYVYMHITVNERGEATLREEDYCKFIHSCALTVASRFSITVEELPPVPVDFEDSLEFSAIVGRLLASDPRSKDENTGWDAASGNIGSRMALDTILSDSQQVSATKFAVSAAEIAPRLFKRVVVSRETEADIQDTTITYDWGDDNLDLSAFGIGSDDEGTISFADGDPVNVNPHLFRGNVTVSSVLPWQMLYTLIYTRTIEMEDVRSRMGITITDSPTPHELRELRLDQIPESTITQKFPDIFGLYVASGEVFAESWLDRDEADAYTVDEL